MSSWMTSEAFISKLAGVMAPRLTLEWTSEPPRHLRDWMARLRLLYGVPFEHLVPDERLLPPESIRFFYLDRNWTDRLVDGALSVGKTTTLEYAQHQAAHSAVTASVDAAEAGVRTELRAAGEAAPTAAPSGGGAAAPAPDITGLLMRSAIVSGWRGLEVRASRGNTQLNLLRMDRLAPDILLCLFADVPTRVEIRQPPEGTQFGVDEVNTSVTPSGFQLKLRYMHGPMAGKLIPNAAAKSVAVPVRAGNPRVIHVARLKDALESALRSAAVPLDPTSGTAGTFSPAEFAVQLQQGPYMQIFEGTASPARRRRSARRRVTGVAEGNGRSNGAVTVPLVTIAAPLSAADLAMLRRGHSPRKARRES